MSSYVILYYHGKLYACRHAAMQTFDVILFDHGKLYA